MRVLVACEFSGIVRDAFIRAGHDAVSCDLLPTEAQGPHIQGDVRKLLKRGRWDLMIAHPPCTRLTNAGVRWLEERDLWDEMYEACAFFNLLLDAPIPKKVLENPIPHRHALIPPYDQIVHPWQHGHPESKSICLWLDSVPELEPTNDVFDAMMRLPKREREDTLHEPR